MKNDWSYKCLVPHDVEHNSDMTRDKTLVIYYVSIDNDIRI